MENIIIEENCCLPLKELKTIEPLKDFGKLHLTNNNILLKSKNKLSVWVNERAIFKLSDSASFAIPEHWTIDVVSIENGELNINFLVKSAS